MSFPCVLITWKLLPKSSSEGHVGLRQPFPEGHWSLEQGRPLPWARAHRGRSQKQRLSWACGDPMGVPASGLGHRRCEAGWGGVRSSQPPLPWAPCRGISRSSLKRMLFGKPQHVINISWAPLKWRTAGSDLKPNPRPARVCLLLVSRLLDLAGMSHQPPPQDRLAGP